MFSSKKDTKGRMANSGTTLLARSVEVLGDVKFAGHLEVEGKVVGNIYAEEGVDARVRILDNGVVEGEIQAPNIVINGHVTGDVRATKHLELAAHAVVNGNVYYQIIEMVKGAEVNGNLVHIQDVEKKRESLKDRAAAQPDSTGSLSGKSGSDSSKAVPETAK